MNTHITRQNAKARMLEIAGYIALGAALIINAPAWAADPMVQQMPQMPQMTPMIQHVAPQIIPMVQPITPNIQPSPNIVPKRAPAFYPDEISTRATCPRDIVVWANKASKVYHLAGMRWYGKTKEGGYTCKTDADLSGYTQAKGG
ncbi:hypothetical protein CCP2SC5_1060007 [Azospirillaceae bacterium]